METLRRSSSHVRRFYRAAPVVSAPSSDVSVSAQYEIREGWTGRFGYLFEFLDENDSAYEDVTPTTLGQVLRLCQSLPDFAAHHLFSSSIQYEF